MENRPTNLGGGRLHHAPPGVSVRAGLLLLLLTVPQLHACHAAARLSPLPSLSWHPRHGQATTNRRSAWLGVQRPFALSSPFTSFR